MSSSKFLLVFGAFLTLAGCNSGSSNASGDVANQKMVCDNSGVDGSQYMNGIVNGQKLGGVNAIAIRTVSLVFRDTDEETGKEKTAICTGSLLPYGVVLTAAHCVPKDPSQIIVAFNNNLYCISNSNVDRYTRKVSRIIKNPKYNGLGSRDEDLAMLKVDGDLANDYYTFSMPKGVSDLRSAKSLVMTGYGVTNFGKDDSGVLRITGTTGKNIYYSDKAPKSIIVDQQASGVCSGDSGGPLLLNTDHGLEIVGVASTVFQADSVKDQSKICNFGATYVDLSKHMDWIKETYARLIR